MAALGPWGLGVAASTVAAAVALREGGAGWVLTLETSAQGSGCEWAWCGREGGQDRSGMGGESSRESIAVPEADSGGGGFMKECVGLIS